VIAASLVLIVVAVVLLGYGLLDGSNTYLVGSILASLLAALALVIGSRRTGGRAAVAAAVEAEELARGRRRARQDELVGVGAGGGPGDRMPPASDEFGDRDDLARRTHDTAVIDMGRSGVPAQSEGGSTGRYGADDEAGRFGRGETGYAEPADRAELDDDFDDDYDEDDPPDEPAPQRVSPADAARVAQLHTEVLVIDGRPRYHLPGCVHLLGRENEGLPVSEAVELGFTPCSLCEPDSALVASARRV